MFGSHCIKSWSVTQSVVSLSSGEAEYYAMVKGAAASMGMRSMMKEFGIKLNIELKCDASEIFDILSYLDSLIRESLMGEILS